MPETTLKPTEYAIIKESLISHSWRLAQKLTELADSDEGRTKRQEIIAKMCAIEIVLESLKSAEYSEPILIRVSKT